MFAKIWWVIRTPFRFVPWRVWLVGLAVAAWFGRGFLLIVATVIVFHPIPVPPIFQGEPETVLEARTQDIHHFRHVRRNERSLDEIARARFDAELDRVRSQLAEMTDAEFQLGLARVQATIDNGHSNASATRMVQPFPRLPLRSTFMNEELRVLRVLPGFEELLGALVTHINDEPALEAAFRFRDAFGGNDASFLSIAPLFLETPDFLRAVDLDGDEIVYRLVLSDGSIVERTLTPVDPEEGARRKYPGGLPLPGAVESERWVGFAPGGDALHLRQPGAGYWMHYLPELDAAYVNLRFNISDDSGESLVDWVRRTTDELAAIGPKVIIVDQRFNTGGDLTQTHILMTALGEIVGPDGRIYLLASGNTFSAGIVNMAMAKDGAPDRTIIVGEEIGDRLQFWAEGWWYSLPNSGFRARYSTGFYDLQNGCEGLFRCHWGSRHIFPVIVDDLDVDISAPLSFEAYAAGRDPAIEAITAFEAGLQSD